MKCPACPASNLRPLQLRADLEAEVCGTCNGAWLDRSEIYQFVKNTSRLAEELAAAYGTAKPSSRPCPRCGRGLAEVRVASAGVSFEACPGCEGNWFDSEEIARLRQAAERALSQAQITGCGARIHRHLSQNSRGASENFPP